MTIISIIYNGYGRFAKKWTECAKAQTVPADEIIIVLGKDHGVTEFEDGVKYIHHGEKATMGFLRNLAVDEAKSDYILYFSIDDILLPNAIEEIKKVDKDLVALRYRHGDKTAHTPEIKKELIPNWWTNYIGPAGYVAFRKGLRYEDTDFPNYPLLFSAYKKGYSFGVTENVCAVYIPRPGGHGRSGNNWNGIQEIKKYLKTYGL